MKKYEFRLQRVLDWRSLQLKSAEAKLGQVRQQLREIDLRVIALQAERTDSESILRKGAVVAGSLISTLDQYLRAITSTEIGLLRNRRDLEQDLAAAVSEVSLRRREHRLLEVLKERGVQEWHHALDRELDQIASDSYFSRWVEESPAAESVAA